MCLVVGTTGGGSSGLTPGTYYLNLQACSYTDQTICSNATLTVQVTDENTISFCPPFYTVNVLENVNIGHELIDLNVTKGNNLGDAGIRYSMKENGWTHNFTVNGTTVCVYLIQHLLKLFIVCQLKSLRFMNSQLFLREGWSCG